MEENPQPIDEGSSSWRRRQNAPEPPAKPGFRDRWFLFAATFFFLAILAGGFYLWRSRAVKPAPVVAPAPPQQEVAEAVPGELLFKGVLQASNVLYVPAPIEGTLESMVVEVGDEVGEDQVLARIRNDTLETAAQAAQEDLDRIQQRVNNLESGLISARLEASRAGADAERARMEFDRAERAAQRQQLLYKEGATARNVYEKSQKDFDNARSEYEALRQSAKVAEDRIASLTRDVEATKRQLDEKVKSLEGAKADLDTASVQSPAAGMLIAAKAKPGEEVNPTVKDLFTIAVDPTEMHVPIEPDPKQAEKLKVGMEAQIQVVEYSGDPIAAEVAKDGEGKWRVNFISPDPLLKPGLNANVKIKLP